MKARTAGKQHRSTEASRYASVARASDSTLRASLACAVSTQKRAARGALSHCRWSSKRGVLLMRLQTCSRRARMAPRCPTETTRHAPEAVSLAPCHWLEGHDESPVTRADGSRRLQNRGAWPSAERGRAAPHSAPRPTVARSRAAPKTRARRRAASKPAAPAIPGSATKAR